MYQEKIGGMKSVLSVSVIKPLTADFLMLDNHWGSHSYRDNALVSSRKTPCHSDIILLQTGGRGACCSSFPAWRVGERHWLKGFPYKAMHWPASCMPVSLETQVTWSLLLWWTKGVVRQLVFLAARHAGMEMDWLILPLLQAMFFFFSRNTETF
jgi:hypothetical protein